MNDFNIITLHMLAGNADFAKMAKALSSFKIKNLNNAKKDFDEKTKHYIKELNSNIHIPLVFFIPKKHFDVINLEDVKIIIKTPLTIDLIKFYSNTEKGSSNPKNTVGTINSSDIEKIIDYKINDFNTLNRKKIFNTIVSVACSAGIKLNNE